MLKRILFSMALLLSVVSSISPVAACSGGPPPWDELLPKLLVKSDVVVLGQYSQLDDMKANGIFHVQSYLQGSGGEYLVISVSDVRGIENNLHVKRFYDMCGAFDPQYVDTTSTYIYFLKRQSTGIYKIQYERSFAALTVITPTPVNIDPNFGEIIQENSDQLSASISAQVGYKAQKPQADLPYPRTTPILLMTQSNQNYMLPVDTTRLLPIPDAELVDLRRDQHDCYAPCTAYSPNGLDKVYLQADGHDLHEIESFVPYVESNAVGQRIVFSASSDSYALWKDNQIQLYALWYPKLWYPDYWLGSMRTPELFNSTAAGNSLQFPVVWSPDGRAMAFSTDEGLWLWDALNVGYPPKLLLPTVSKVPIARYFSPRGRYLAIEDGDRRYNLDLVTGQELPDGYVSPDDRKLLAFDTGAKEPTTLNMMYLAPGIREFEYYPEVKFLKVQWIDDAYFRASITGFGYLTGVLPPGRDPREGVDLVLVEKPFYDTVPYHSSGILTILRQYEVPYLMQDVQMKDFTYKNGPGLIQISVDGYSVLINKDGLLSLASALTSPIKMATWLPSAFYYADKAE